MKVLMAISLSLLFVLTSQVLVYALTWDFDDTAQLKDWTVINGKWSIEGGKLKGELLGDYMGIVAGDLGWSDYTLEMETTVVEGKYTYWMVRVQDNPLSYYAMERNESSSSPIWRRDAGTHTKIANDVALPANNLESHIWKIEAKGDTITTYIDGKELLSAKDATYAKGRIGLGGHNSGSATGKNVVTFDYVKVEGTGIPTAAAVKSIGKLSVAWGSLKVGY